MRLMASDKYLYWHKSNNVVRVGDIISADMGVVAN